MAESPGKTTLNRREFFSLGLGTLKERVPLQKSPQSRRNRRPILRPPGAVSEEILGQECTSCGDCVVACQFEAIRLLDHRAGKYQGTPAIIPRIQPCLYCEDFPCVTACKEGALTKDHLKMGVAELDSRRCFNTKGGWCDACFQKCPFSGEAIRLNERLQLEINADFCTGCGLCEHACPLSPPAIRIVPLEI
ncbi:MAG: 4Fe-4S dicluster domain-containing protein [Calditrichaeota bacterium]|nr:4Fe-4S dicluster domain-containing protein [Calditrichota bacterium]